jgi:hypothetical protein
MEKIEIRVNDVLNPETGIKSGFKHLYIIYTFADGTEYIVRGGPSDIFLAGEIDVEFGRYTPASRDWVPPEERLPQDSFLLKEGESLEADYLRMVFNAQMIEQADVDYDTMQAAIRWRGRYEEITNSNTVVASALSAIGVPSSVTLLPESVADATEVPGFYNVASLEVPIMAFVLGLTRQDVVTTDAGSYSGLEGLYDALLAEFQSRFEGKLSELTNFTNGQGEIDFPEYIGRCFLPHTPITLADGTMRAIEAIRPGDHVLSYAADGSLTPARVTRDRTEIARLSAEITKAEARIDSIVYALFDLTPDEIALLESVA